MGGCDQATITSVGIAHLAGSYIACHNCSVGVQAAVATISRVR
jgi:hypothetical protein